MLSSGVIALLCFTMIVHVLICTCTLYIYIYTCTNTCVLIPFQELQDEKSDWDHSLEKIKLLQKLDPASPIPLEIFDSDVRLVKHGMCTCLHAYVYACMIQNCYNSTSSAVIRYMFISYMLYKLEFPLFIRWYRDSCLALYCLI